jgi:hypothetical protein
MARQGNDREGQQQDWHSVRAHLHAPRLQDVGREQAVVWQLSIVHRVSTSARDSIKADSAPAWCAKVNMPCAVGPSSQKQWAEQRDASHIAFCPMVVPRGLATTCQMLELSTLPNFLYANTVRIQRFATARVAEVMPE